MAVFQMSRMRRLVSDSEGPVSDTTITNCSILLSSFKCFIESGEVFNLDEYDGIVLPFLIVEGDVEIEDYAEMVIL